MRAASDLGSIVTGGQEFGVTEDDVPDLIAEIEGKPNKLDARAKAVLKAAGEMTSALAVSDATFAELKKGFDNERLTDLVINMAFYNAVVRYLGTLQIDVEPEYQPYLDKFPLPKNA